MFFDGVGRPMFIYSLGFRPIPTAEEGDWLFLSRH